jgi:hypothetical protein
MGEFIVTDPSGKRFKVTAPQGATQDQVLEYAKQHFQTSALSQPADTAGFFERIGMGAERTFEGAAQLAEHAMPGATYFDAANNWLADTWFGKNVMGLGKVDMPPGWDPTDPWNLLPGSSGLDRQIKEREAERERRTPPGAEMPIIGDPAQLAGAVMSPVTWAFTPAKVGAIGAGAVGGALQPTTSPDFAAQKGLQVATGAAVGGAFKLGGKALGSVAERVMSYFGRKYPDTMISKAASDILKRVEAGQKSGGPSMVDLMKLVNEAHGRGQPMTVADVAALGRKSGASKPLRGYLGHLYRKGSLETQARIADFFQERDEAVPDRLFDYIKKTINPNDGYAYSTTEALLDTRSRLGKPLWDKVYQLQNIWSQRLEDLYRSQDARRGLQLGYHIIRNEDLAAGRPFDPTQQHILSQNGDEIVIGVGQKPNMRVLQMVKQGLDALIDESVDPRTGRLTKLGVSRVKLRDAYVEELKRLDPTRGGRGTKVPGIYERALNAWAGESANLDAFRMGQDILGKNIDPSEITARFAKMSESEREFVRLGVALKMREVVSSAGERADEAKSILKKNKWTKMQLRPIFKTPEGATEFLDTVLPAETVMHKFKGEVTAGSPTAERVAEDMRARTARLADLGYNVARGHWHGALMNLFHIFQRLGMEPSDELMDEAAKLMLQTRFRPGDKATQALLGQLPKSPRQRIQAATGGRAAGWVAGNLPVVRWHGLLYEQTPDGQLHLVPGQSLRAYDTAKP